MARQRKSASLLAIILLVLAPLVFASVSWAQSQDSEFDRAQHQKADEVISDLLIVLDSDGRSHIAQHSIASNGPTISVRLPGSVVPQEVLIFGPAQEAYREQYQSDPKLLTLENGSAFVRYQHQYGNEVEQIQPGHFVLSVESVPFNINTPTLNRSTITWVFPSEYELVSYTVADENTGNWVVASNTLTFDQSGIEPATLSINYKNKKASRLRLTPECPEGIPERDDCADDLDEDGVPDYRDICISEKGQTNNAYGCLENHNMTLTAINFTTGRTYLDINSRAALDKVANALSGTPDVYFEIGSHTDNEGAASSNLLLSRKRADAVRHYLILKGVNPNSISATGYGEKYPIRDNASTDGRRANRRIELVVIN